MPGMTSIPHIEDIPPRVLLEATTQGWKISEKLDGSSLQFGLDEEGRFYTKRKGAPPCYEVEDWSTECWASTYRMAHYCTGMLVSELIQHDLISKGHWFQAEIIHGNIPNTVIYSLPSDIGAKVVIFASNMKFNSDLTIVLDSFSVFAPPGMTYSPDGKTLQDITLYNKWSFSHLRKHSEYACGIDRSLVALERTLKYSLSRDSKVPGFTCLEIMEASLSKKHPKTGDRKWSELKEAIKAEKASIQKEYEYDIAIFKNFFFNQFSRQGVSSVPSVAGMQEGFVVEVGDLTFKMVDRHVFPALNLFTHRVKYWLVGGRRPTRPSFLSRTKNWTKEKRLERLDVLLERYLRHHDKLRFSGETYLVRYQGDLHRRVLNMFYDTRKRIENGR